MRLIMSIVLIVPFMELKAVLLDLVRRFVES